MSIDTKTIVKNIFVAGAFLRSCNPIIAFADAVDDTTAESAASEAQGASEAVSGSAGTGGRLPTATELVEGYSYEPDEVLPESKVKIDEEKVRNAPGTLEQMVAILIRFMLPYLAIAAVCVIIYNVIANFFRPEEEKVPMMQILKEIVKGFFFIIFSFLIVEVILYVILGGEVWLSEYLTS